MYVIGLYIAIIVAFIIVVSVLSIFMVPQLALIIWPPMIVVLGGKYFRQPKDNRTLKFWKWN